MPRTRPAINGATDPPPSPGTDCSAYTCTHNSGASASPDGLCAQSHTQAEPYPGGRAMTGQHSIRAPPVRSIWIEALAISKPTRRRAPLSGGWDCILKSASRRASWVAAEGPAVGVEAPHAAKPIGDAMGPQSARCDHPFQPSHPPRAPVRAYPASIQSLSPRTYSRVVSPFIKYLPSIAGVEPALVIRGDLIIRWLNESAWMASNPIP